LRVTGFEWDEDNITHIAKHQLAPEEVEEVFRHDFRVYKGRRGRYMAYGRSLEGRYLFIVFEHLSRGRIRVITAREMSGKEKKRFRRQLR